MTPEAFEGDVARLRERPYQGPMTPEERRALHAFARAEVAARAAMDTNTVSGPAWDKFKEARAELTSATSALVAKVEALSPYGHHILCSRMDAPDGCPTCARIRSQYTPVAQEPPLQVLQALADTQQPLPVEAEKVLRENIWNLYAPAREEPPKEEACTCCGHKRCRLIRDAAREEPPCVHDFTGRPSLCSKCGEWNPKQPDYDGYVRPVTQEPKRGRGAGQGVPSVEDVLRDMEREIDLGEGRMADVPKSLKLLTAARQALRAERAEAQRELTERVSTIMQFNDIIGQKSDQLRALQSTHEALVQRVERAKAALKDYEDAPLSSAGIAQRILTEGGGG